jgi:hypothetical protein
MADPDLHTLMPESPPAQNVTPRLPKPPYGDPCNHCGRCCTKTLCWIGSEILGPEAKAPCPALIDCGEMFCGLMARPQDYRPEQAKTVGVEPMRES